jgi:hypothetical protein
MIYRKQAASGMMKSSTPLGPFDEAIPGVLSVPRTSNRERAELPFQFDPFDQLADANSRVAHLEV